MKQLVLCAAFLLVLMPALASAQEIPECDKDCISPCHMSESYHYTESTTENKYIGGAIHDCSYPYVIPCSGGPHQTGATKCTPSGGGGGCGSHECRQQEEDQDLALVDQVKMLESADGLLFKSLVVGYGENAVLNAARGSLQLISPCNGAVVVNLPLRASQIEALREG
jgi:hypothetical protein